MISFLKEAARWSGWEAGGLNCNPELTMSRKKRGYYIWQEDKYCMFTRTVSHE